MKLTYTNNIFKFYGFIKSLQKIKNEIFEAIFFDYYYKVDTQRHKFDKDYINIS